MYYGNTLLESRPYKFNAYLRSMSEPYSAQLPEIQRILMRLRLLKMRVLNFFF